MSTSNGIGRAVKVQFKIRIDPELFDMVNELDLSLNRSKTNGYNKKRINVSKSMYWEGVMKEHMNSREVMMLLALSSGKVKGGGTL